MSRDAIEAKAREDAIGALGERLCFKMWHSDPDTPEPPDWAALSEFDRAYYVSLVEWLLSHRALIRAAL